MARIDNLDGGELARLKARISALENATPLSNTSVERGRLRMYDGSELLIQNGNLTVSGTATITGALNGSGTVTWTGTSNLNGPVNIAGLATLNNNLVLGTGTIKAGTITIDKLGAYGGRIVSSNSLFLEAPAGQAIIVSPYLGVAGPSNFQGNVDVTGNHTVSGTKSFRMDHPTKPGYWIQHGSTESPISGTEYTGTGTFDASGECLVTLPDYFEAVNKLENRTVHLTAIGRPFMVGVDRVVGGKFTAYGNAGREFDWVVKAERFGGDFEVEPKKPEDDYPSSSYFGQ